MTVPATTGASSASPIIAFGAMTCTESCISTLLHMYGCDYVSFFMNYWNLYYENGTLLAGRNMRGIDLHYPYGIETEWMESVSLDACADMAADKNRCALVVTLASKLPYFPRQSLAFEGDGFEHYILVHGYRANDGKFQVIDPIADYAGDLSGELLQAASPYGDELKLWSLHRVADYQAPSAREAFALASKHNYVRNLRIGDCLGRVREELVRFEPSPSGQQLVWIARNNIAVTTIVKNRKLIWRSLSAAGVLPPDRAERLGAEFHCLVTLWTQLNLLLFKWSKSGFAAPLRDAILRKLESIGAAESGILKSLYQEGGTSA